MPTKLKGKTSAGLASVSNVETLQVGLTVTHHTEESIHKEIDPTDLLASVVCAVWSSESEQSLNQYFVLSPKKG